MGLTRRVCRRGGEPGRGRQAGRGGGDILEDHPSLSLPGLFGSPAGSQAPHDYLPLHRQGEGEVRGGDDALRARWFSWSEIDDLVFAFDHRQILESFLRFQGFLRQRKISWEEWGRALLE